MWLLNSRLQWISLGDRNAKFLQTTALNRRRKNKIVQLHKPDLSWNLNPSEIEYETLAHLIGTFTHHSPHDPKYYSNLSPNNFPSLPPTSQTNLISPTIDLENNKALDNITPLNPLERMGFMLRSINKIGKLLNLN